MPPLSLTDWLDYQQSLHATEIDLGLARVGAVWRLLHPQPVRKIVLTVAGTNGKGSSVAYLDAMLRAAGYRVGRYTSPHLQQYNERICIDGVAVADEALCAAFAQIEQARGAIPLTYFEFGTLAAFLLFDAAAVDVMVLEVGLGGRLDATNLLDADGVIISSIGLDHMNWLGDTLEAIAREKAGVMRAGAPVVVSQADAPNCLAEIATALGAPLFWQGLDFHAQAQAESHHWRWQTAATVMADLPLPALAGAHQIANAAGVIMLLHALRARLPVSVQAIRQGLQQVHLPARFQIVREQPLVVVDVAHNAEAAQVLAAAMAARRDITNWRAVFSIFADKPVQAVISALRDQVTGWYFYTLQGKRAASLTSLQNALRDYGVTDAYPHDSLASALAAALQDCHAHEGVVIFGSFEVAGAALALLAE